MAEKKLILKKESFGGLFTDTSLGRFTFLRQEEYEPKKQELERLRQEGKQVKFVDVTPRGYPLLTDALSTPNSIFWELTKKCDGKCTDCFMDANASKWSGQESSFSEIENIVLQFSSLGGYAVRLTGGEPTQRNDFFDIVDLLNQQSMIVGMNTNGFFGQDKLEGILSREIKDIRISVDGPESINDSVRGQGSYRKAMRTIRAIAEYNQSAQQPVELTMNLVLMKRNFPFIEEMIELSQSLGTKLSLGLLRLSGRAKIGDMLSPEQVAQVAYRVQQQRDRLGIKKGKVRVNYDIFCEGQQTGKGSSMVGYHPHPFDNSRCYLGSSGFTLDSFARLVPCGYLINADEWVGEDIRGKDLLDVWYNSQILQKARAISRQGCTDCGYHIVKCNGGCPAMAYFLTGDVNGKDPYCVRNVSLTEIRGEK